MAKNTRRHLSPFTLPIPGWGKRRMTTEDFERVCQREGITVHRAVIGRGIRGIYFRRDGEPHIIITPRLRGTEKLRVEFHELAHYFLHDGERVSMREGEFIGSKFRNYSKRLTPAQEWAEVEANTAAIVAIAPGFSLLLFLQFCTQSIASDRKWREARGSK